VTSVPTTSFYTLKYTNTQRVNNFCAPLGILRGLFGLLSLGAEHKYHGKYYRVRGRTRDAA
jgi:hypothetical protein